MYINEVCTLLDIMLEPTLIAVFHINFISIIFHVFGFYCLQVQRGGNVNQRILLKNLSVIEVVKIINDYISITSYYVYKDWYNVNEHVLDAIEVVIMTVIFFSFIIISIERLVCITLNMKYKIYVTDTIVSRIVLLTWAVGIVSGFVLWIGEDISDRKLYFYLVLDILVISFTLVTYSIIFKIYHQTRRQVLQKKTNVTQELKILRVPLMIIASFLLCNSIPDVILFVVTEKMSEGMMRNMYNASIVMWAVGFLLDPLIYIFLNKKTRSIAKLTLKKLIRLGVPRQKRKQAMKDQPMDVERWSQVEVKWKNCKETTL